MKYQILSKVNSPADIKTLDFQGLELLCEEIRDKLISTVSKNGGMCVEK